MNTRTPAALLSLSAVALVSATAEPAAVATDSCVEPGEKMCPPGLQSPPDEPEHEHEAAVVKRIGAAQAPPPAGLRTMFMWMVPMWTGELASGAPAGWLDGTGLTEKDYFVINGKGGEFRQVIDGVRSVAKEDGWAQGEAQKAVRAVAAMQLSGNLPDPESSEFFRIIRAVRPHAELPHREL